MAYFDNAATTYSYENRQIDQCRSDLLVQSLANQI